MKKKLTKNGIAACIGSGGKVCPYCGKYREMVIKTETVVNHDDERRQYRRVVCPGCKKAFYYEYTTEVVYELSSVTAERPWS